MWMMMMMPTKKIKPPFNVGRILTFLPLYQTLQVIVVVVVVVVVSYLYSVYIELFGKCY
jgi:hypothetical protein